MGRRNRRKQETRGRSNEEETRISRKLSDDQRKEEQE